MPEYVYALHDFLPEHDDEVEFRAGERIEVVEKDDLYGDGWWQGRNLSGKVGLFPRSYTQPAPPQQPQSSPPSAAPTATSAASASHLAPIATSASGARTPSPEPAHPPTSPGGLHSLPEESENESVAPPKVSVSSDGTDEGAVMRETMTDVQQAIEQLGQRRNNGAGGHTDDEGRSFTFSSVRESESTDRESDIDMELETEGDEGTDGEGWNNQKNVRKRLAKKVSRANEEERREREREAQLEVVRARERGSIMASHMAPPIEVELSDESEDEGDDEHHHHVHDQEDKTEHGRVASQRSSSQMIPEEDEDDHLLAVPTATRGSFGTPRGSEPIVPSEDYIVPSPGSHKTGYDEVPTATQASFPVAAPASERTSSPYRSGTLPSPISPGFTTGTTTGTGTVTDDSRPTSTQPSTAFSKTFSVGDIEPIATPIPVSNTANATGEPPATTLAAAANLLPSPAASSAMGRTTSPVHKSGLALSPSSPGSGGPRTGGSSGIGSGHPSDWTMDEVVEWLRAKGFDEGVCEKFIEQEITGDVLLELDVNLLKSEIGIPAFGKRMRIANAIMELRRPPSALSSNHDANSQINGAPGTGSSQFNGAGNNGFRGHSQSQSLAMSHSSAPQSLNSPFMLASPISAGSGPASVGGGVVVTSTGSPMAAAGMIPAESFSAPNTGLMGMGAGESPMGTGLVRRDSDPGVRGPGQGQDDDQVGLGLGIPSALLAGKNGKGRPSQLTLSPSDSALGESVKAVAGGAYTADETEDDRAVASENDGDKKLKTRKSMFGRSGSKSSKDGDSSKDPVTPNSIATPQEEGSPVQRRTNGRRQGSLDANKGNDRLSIFGGAFSGSLSKSRKPPPRYSAMVDNADLQHEKSNPFALLGRSGKKSSSGRPSTSDGHSTHKKSFDPAATPSKKSHKEKDEKASRDSKDSKERPSKEQAVLRRRTSSQVSSPTRGGAPNAAASGAGAGAVAGASAGVGTASGGEGTKGTLKAGQSILQQIGQPDHNGWMRKKGDRYNTWKSRYFVLKGPHLYWLRSNSSSETKIKGYLNIAGYKIITDEKVDPGKYGFKLVQESVTTHYFSSEEQLVIREWMKALMKATIDRDYTKPVVSSVNIPTIPLTVAQAMNPAPRPPSPTARAATQKALRRENTNQLSTRDAQILMMGVSGDATDNGSKMRLDSFFNQSNDTAGTPMQRSTPAPLGARAMTPKGPAKSPPPMSVPAPAPARPSREMRRLTSDGSNLKTDNVPTSSNSVETNLIEWANSHLPHSLRISESTPGPLYGGLAILRLSESIKGRPASPPVPDSAFPSGPNDDKLDGLFRLFDFLLDNDVKMGSVSINDVRMGKRDKILQLLKALKAWEDKRRQIAESIGSGASGQAGPFMAPVSPWGPM